VTALAARKSPTAAHGVAKSVSIGERLASQWSMHSWLIRPSGTRPKHGGIDVPMNTAATPATTA
jgi:hypothetical protein